MKIHTELNIPSDHPAFAGHFPGIPIVPGVLLLDAALHAINNTLLETTGQPLHNFQISSVKFLSPLTPGVGASITHEVLANGSVRFDIVAGTRPIVSGNLSMNQKP